MNNKKNTWMAVLVAAVGAGGTVTTAVEHLAKGRCLDDKEAVEADKSELTKTVETLRTRTDTLESTLKAVQEDIERATASSGSITTGDVTGTGIAIGPHASAVVATSDAKKTALEQALKRIAKVSRDRNAEQVEQ